MHDEPGRTPRQGRILSLDGLRGVACLAVLLLHIGIMVLPFGPSALYSLIPGTPAVMTFFVLSGVVLSIAPFKELRRNRDYGWLSYFPRRVVRLGVPMAVAIALGVAAGYVAWRIGSDSRSALAVDYTGGAQKIVHDVLMQFDLLFNVSDDGVNLYGDPLVRVDPPVWSMSWELWFSLTLPLAVAAVRRIRHEGLFVAGALAAVLLSLWSGYFPLRLCLMFWFGVLLAKRLDALSRRRLPPAAEVLAAAAALVLIELPLAGRSGLLGPAVAPEGVAEALLMLGMCAASAALVALSVGDGLLRRALSLRVPQFFGKISFSLYLTHAIVIGGLEAVLPRLGVTSGPVQALVALAASVLVGWAFWYVVERPSIALSRRVGEALGAAPAAGDGAAPEAGGGAAPATGDGGRRA